MNDLFAGTAWYYARYRPGYPHAVLEVLRSAFQLDGTGRLLDLGCGTGELARALHRYFTEVIGVDLSPDMLEEARRQSDAAGIANIGWRCQAAEDLSTGLGGFQLVTLGNAFHWMRQDEVLEKAYGLLSHGGIAILGNPGGIWTGVDAWERVVREVVTQCLGTHRRTRAGVFTAEEGAEHRAMSRSRFKGITSGVHHWSRVVNVDAIIGELYSTSFANKALLGENAEAFEADVRQALHDMDSSGQFVQHLRTEYLLGFKP
jgi:2-polyprenyl-3-methyl-5-hydroxy-6-metoxy-1,4-benzoquinol methylase